MCIRDSYVHRSIAKVLGLPPSRVRVIATPQGGGFGGKTDPVSYTHLRAHETVLDIVCRLLLEKKKNHPDNSEGRAP